MKTKTLVLKHTGYTIEGVADLTLWGGGKACIEMAPFTLKTLTKDRLKAKINDAGFGVERINGAICDVYENYEGTFRYKKSIIIGEVSAHTGEVYNGPPEEI